MTPTLHNLFQETQERTPPNSFYEPSINLRSKLEKESTREIHTILSRADQWKNPQQNKNKWYLAIYKNNNTLGPSRVVPGMKTGSIFKNQCKLSH